MHAGARTLGAGTAVHANASWKRDEEGGNGHPDEYLPEPRGDCFNGSVPNRSIVQEIRKENLHMRYQVFYRQPALRHTLIAVALAAAYSSASALPSFTLNPAAAGLNGTAFTADNILISDFSGVTFTSATNFVDNGFLQITSFQLGGSTFTPTGLNAGAGGYGLWFRFQATGHLTSGTAATVLSAPSAGVFDTLTYTLSGGNGVQTFAATPAGGTCTGCAGGILLASGSLIGGGVGSTLQVDPNTGANVFVPNAAATVSFAAAAGGFFQSPTPFYTVALTSFTNTISEIAAGPGGFAITQGGGSINFASPIPEPDTYALMLGGLGVLGFLARRRRS